MNSWKAIIAIGFFCFVLVQNSNTESIDTSVIKIETEKSVKKWVEFWNTYDLDKVDELFLQDDRLTYFSSEKEGAIIGYDAVREHHKEFGFVSGGKEQPNKLWVKDLHFADFDSSVIVTGIWYFQKPAEAQQRGPVTIVYIQQGDQFRIAHMNFSDYKDENKKEEI
jgi:hypothetical protein